LTQPQKVEELAQLRPKLMAFFRWSRCESPEDETQETTLRALKQLNDPKTLIDVPLQTYVNGIARNVLRESRRRRRETPMDPSGEQFSKLSATPRLTEDEKILVQEFLAQLSAEECSFILEFHRIGAEELGKRQEVTANAVRIRAHRIHKKLEKFVMEKIVPGTGL
jgi:DNA-directed RNA polymerase specialized sigma24 family protein